MSAVCEPFSSEDSSRIQNPALLQAVYDKL